MSGKKGSKFNLGDSEKKQLSSLKKDSVPVRLDKIQPQKGVRRTGINRAWRLEKKLVEKTGRGTRDWTPKQIKELKTRGKVSDFKGHHIVNVKSNPALAGDPRNIVFVSKAEHKLVHGNDFKNATRGRGIDRSTMIKQFETKGVTRTVGEKIAEAEARATQRIKLNPEQAQELAKKVDNLNTRLKPSLAGAQKVVKGLSLANDVKNFVEADDKVVAGAKFVGKQAGARVGAAIGTALGAPFGGVGAPIGAAIGSIGGGYVGEYIAEKGVIVFRKLKNRVVKAINDEAQPEPDPPKRVPEEVVKIVLRYSSDEEITLPVVDDISDEDVPLPKKKPLPKPAKAKQPKEVDKEASDYDDLELPDAEDLEELDLLDEEDVIVYRVAQDVGEELTEEDVEGIKAIFSDDLERDLFDVANFVTDNLMPDNDTKKVVQAALDCYAFARGHKDITDPMAVAGALINYLPPELQKIASPVLKGAQAIKTMTEMADKLQNGLDAIQLADVTNVLALVSLIPGIPPEVSAVIGVISAAAKLASLLAAGSVAILPVALAVASLLLALHKMFDLFSGLGGGGGDGDGDGNGDGDGDNDGSENNDPADDGQPDDGQADPNAQGAPGNGPGNGQTPGEGQGDPTPGQQPPQGPIPAATQRRNQPMNPSPDNGHNEPQANQPQQQPRPQQAQPQRPQPRQAQPQEQAQPQQQESEQQQEPVREPEADQDEPANEGAEDGAQRDKTEQERREEKEQSDFPRQNVNREKLPKAKQPAPGLKPERSEELGEEEDAEYDDVEHASDDSPSEVGGEGEFVSDNELEDLEGSDLAPIDAFDLEDDDLLPKGKQRVSEKSKAPASREEADGSGESDEEDMTYVALALSDFDGEEFDLEPFLAKGEKRKGVSEAKSQSEPHGESDNEEAGNGSDLDGDYDTEHSGSEAGDDSDDFEGVSNGSQETTEANDGVELEADESTEFQEHTTIKANDLEDEVKNDNNDHDSFSEELAHELEADFTEEEIAEAKKRVSEAKGESSNATVWAKIDAMCQYIEEVDYVSAMLNEDTAFEAAQKQLLLAFTNYNTQRSEWRRREHTQRRETNHDEEMNELADTDKDEVSKSSSDKESLSDLDHLNLDDSDHEELPEFDEDNLSMDVDEALSDDNERERGDDKGPNTEHLGKIVGHRTIDDDPERGKAIYRPSATRLRQKRHDREEEPEGVIFKENYDQHQHEFMKKVTEKAFYRARQTETSDKSIVSTTIVNKEKLFKQLISGEISSALKAMLSDEQAQSLSNLTKGNASFCQAVLELLSDDFSAAKQIAALIQFWKPLAKLFVISDGIFPQQFSELQPFMNKLNEVLVSSEYLHFVEILPNLETLAEQASALKFDSEERSEDEKNMVEKDNRDVTGRILCKGMEASDEVATVNCLESPLDFQGIHYSDDISHILPIHALQLENPELEIMFWRDYTEKRLVTYEHDGGVIDDSNDDYAQMPRAKETLNYLINERAPFIVCLNTPITMKQEEALAVKLLVLNVMRQCLIEQRSAMIFGFTSKDQPNEVQQHVLTPDFSGLLTLFDVCKATFDRSESFHEVYSWNTCEHAPLHNGAAYLKAMESKGQSLLAEFIITSRHFTSLSWPYALLPANGKLLVHLVEPKTVNYCSALLENDIFSVLVEPKTTSDLPVVAFIDSRSQYAQGVDHYRAEESERKGVHHVFWDGSKTGEGSSVCLAFDSECSFEFNAGINLDQFAVKGASPFINALAQPKTVANVEKSLVSLTTFGNGDEISISSNLLLQPTSMVSLPTVNFCCSLIHHVDFDELSMHPINSAVMRDHLELWLKADAGVTKPEWHWQDQSAKQRDINDITEDNNQLPVLNFNETTQHKYLQFNANTHYAVNDLLANAVEVFVVHEQQGMPVTLGREIVPFNSLSVFPTAKVNCLNLKGGFLNVYEIIVLRQGSPAECIEVVTKYLKKKYNV